ncbi:MAG: hypothetical protein SFZ03_11170 [Candidatus Melainabacteria bacterium]|nr:hypothetical protein [Candidatus Melainabacteria bacterium]
MIAQLVKEGMVFLIVLAALYFVCVMFVSSGYVDISVENAYDLGARALMLQGLQRYFIGMGAALLLSAVAYIWLDKEDQLITTVGGK